MSAPAPIRPTSTLPSIPVAAAGSSGNGKITLFISHPGENEGKPIAFYDEHTFEPYFTVYIEQIDPKTNKAKLRFFSFEDLYFYHTDEYLLEEMGAGTAGKQNVSDLTNSRMELQWNSKCPYKEQGILLPVRNELNSLVPIKDKKIHVYIERISGTPTSQTIKLTIEGPFKQERSDKREFKIVQI